jgi:hypothetical protein
MSGLTSLNNWQIERIFESRYNEYRIQSESLGLGDVVDSLAKDIQQRFGIEEVPYPDAYEMAYNEIVIPKIHY